MRNRDALEIVIRLAKEAVMLGRVAGTPSQTNEAIEKMEDFKKLLHRD